MYLSIFRKECGLDKFVPHSLLDSMKGKDLRKMLSHYIKLNQGLTAPGQKQLTELQAKLHYMKMIGELRSFGGKCFIATLVVRNKSFKDGFQNYLWCQSTLMESK